MCDKEKKLDVNMTVLGGLKNLAKSMGGRMPK
jgi:hypothetical protein